MANGEYCYKIFTEHKEWTEEELRKAKPVPSYISELDKKVTKNEEKVKEIEKASREDAGPGFVGWDASVPEGYVPELTHSSAVSNPQQYPFSCVGKLTFEDINGEQYYGSAAVVQENGIITAAHCIYDHANKCYFKNIVFYPGLTDKSNLGQFEVTDTVFPEAYKMASIGLIRDDIAFCRVNVNRKTGKTVTKSAFGFIGAMLDQKIHQNVWFAVGYPGLKGEFEMWKDEGKLIPYIGDEYVTKSNQHPEFKHHGMSGGPWLVFNTNYYINGVTSKGTKDGLDNESYSPYFGKWVSTLYKSFFK